MLWFLALIVLVAVAILAAVYLKQDELIFFPQPPGYGRRWRS